MNKTYKLLGGKLQFYDIFEHPTEDALWLAACYKPTDGESILDAGGGNGIIGLSLKARINSLNITCLDVDTTILNQAQAHSELNGISAAFVNTDFTRLPFQTKSFDTLFCNPPFYPAEAGHSTDVERRKMVRSQPPQKLPVWLEEFQRVAKQTLVLLHSQSLDDVTPPCRKIFLQSHPERPAKRVIVELNTEGEDITIPTYDTALRKAILFQGKFLSDLL